MSDHEEIARLTGKLVFDVNSSPLKAFEAMLKNAALQMRALSKEADTLKRKLNTAFGVKNGNSADHEKLQKSVRASLDRELKGEIAVQKARKATFQAELASQKLVSAGTRENVALQTQATRHKITQAVLDAKAAKADQERLKANGIEIKQAQGLETHKLRQSRLEAVLAQQQQRTILLQQKQQANMTAMQRATLALNQARERGLRAAEKYQAGLVNQKARTARQDERSRQQDEKHGWAVQRQAAWTARQAEPKPSTGFLGLGTGALAVGGAAAGIAAIVGAIGALGDRLGATQARVSESQQFSNILEQAAGKNPANKDFARDEFLRISAKYGTAVDNDSAKDYRTFLLAQMARGQSLSASTASFETQQSAYRGAGMTREEQRRTSLQLQQVRSKGQGDREDLNTFSEAAPLLIEPIRRSWAERNHYKGNNLEGDFRQSTTAGNLKAIDFEKGIALFVKENSDAIRRQSDSIDANATRLSNNKFLQQQGLDQSPELIGAINNRLQSEMELNAALKPLSETAIKVDTALNNLAATFLRWTLGKDSTPEQAGNKIDSLSPDSPAIKPATFGGKQNTGEPVARDPIDRLFRFLTGTPDYKTEGPAAGLQAPTVKFNGAITPPKLDASTFELPEIGDKFYRLMLNAPKPISAADISAQAAQRVYKEYGSADVSPVVNNNNSVTNNLAAPNVTVNLDVTGMKADEVIKLVSEQSAQNTQDAMQKAFGEFQQKETK
ncbi:hypothetical protein ABQX22_00505 [Xanthomonas sp. WHRI 1810A]|uniref:hypothetical protein n=1 Tax=Xanthomonas sp. WHRI 1810A TaxID=3161565 RepID=UPI0032E87541